MQRLMVTFHHSQSTRMTCLRTKCVVGTYARGGKEAAEIRSLCPSHTNGVSIARSNSDTFSDSVSSRIAATMSGARVVRFTIRLT